MKTIESNYEKYTKDYCEKNNIVVHVDTPEEVKEIDNLTIPNSHNYLYESFFHEDKNQCIKPYTNRHSSITYFKSIRATIIEAKEFIDSFKFPEKWSIVTIRGREKEQRDLFNELREIINLGGWSGGGSYSYNYYGNRMDHENSTPKFPLVTIEQLRNHYLNKKQMTKKIIGYRLSKPEYKEAALQISPRSQYLLTGTSNLGKDYIGNLDAKNDTYDHLNKAGVIDLWFTPVYEEDVPTSKVFTLGYAGYKLKISKDGTIMCNDGTFTIEDFKKIFRNTIDGKPMRSGDTLHYNTSGEWLVFVKNVPNLIFGIGCNQIMVEVTAEEVREIVNIHEQLNK